MSKNKNDHNLLIPGDTGWEIWSRSSNTYKLFKNTEETHALSIEKLPTNKPLIMAFPVTELTSLALRAPNEEEENVSDLIAFQVEKMGLSASEEKGILHQYSVVGGSEKDHSSLYTIDVLRAPREGSLPSKSPQRFSVSPRCFPFEKNSITLWKEFNKWVMALTDKSGEVIYYQGFNESQLKSNLVQDIKFIIGQLLIQNIIKERPENFIIWTEAEGLYPEGFNEIEQAIPSTLRVAPKPTPISPPHGILLPADTRAQRIKSKRKKRNKTLLALTSLLLIGLLGYAGYALWDLDKRAKLALSEADSLKEENQALLDHRARWEELGPLVDTENNPASLLIKCNKSIPNRDLRLTRAEFTHQFTQTEAGRELSIILSGEANDFSLASKFDENLQKSKDLTNFTWTNQEASQSKTGWKFIYRADQK